MSDCIAEQIAKELKNIKAEPSLGKERQKLWNTKTEELSSLFMELAELNKSREEVENVRKPLTEVMPNGRLVFIPEKEGGTYPTTKEVKTWEEFEQVMSEHSKHILGQLDSEEAAKVDSKAKEWLTLYRNLLAGETFKPITIELSGDRVIANPGKDQKSVTAVYRRSANKIRIATNAETFRGKRFIHPVKVMFHEYVHALTIEHIDKYPALKKEAEKLLAIARKEADAKGVSFYGLTDIYEFVAESVTSVEFGIFLGAIEYKDGSVLGRVKDVVRILIDRVKGKGEGAKSVSLLDAAIGLAQSSMNPKEDVKKSEVDNIAPWEDVPMTKAVNSDPELKELYSDIDFEDINTQDYSQEAANILAEPGKMVELGEKLEGIQATRDPEHASHLMKELGKLSTTFKVALPAVRVMLNEAADRNQGIIQINEKANIANLYIDVGPGKSSMSPLEVYVHELIHAATDFVLSSAGAAAAALRREIVGIRSDFVNHPKVVEVLAKYMPNKRTATEDAERLLDYITKGSDAKSPNRGLKEFVAYARTHQPLRKALEELSKEKLAKKDEPMNFMERIGRWLQRLFGELKKRYRGQEGDTDLDRMIWLTERLMEANNKSTREVQIGRITQAINYVSKLDEKIGNAVDSFKQKQASKPLLVKGKDGNPAKYRTAANTIFRGLFDREARKNLKNAMEFSGITGSNTIRMMLGRMTEDDQVEDAIDTMSMIAQRLDMERKNAELSTIAQVKAAFREELTEGDKDALNVMYEADLVSLWDRHEPSEFLDYSEVDGKIKAIEDKLRKVHGERDYNYYTTQAEMLAEFVKDGQPNILLIKNAEGIARKINDPKNRIPLGKEVNQELVRDIDELASLYGLRLIGKERVDALKDLATREEAGFALMMSYIEAEQRISKKELFEGYSRMEFSKGYRADVYPDNMEVRIANLDEAAVLRKQGFKLLRKAEKHSKSTAKEQGVFVSTMPVRTTLHKQALRFKNMDARGTSIMMNHFKDGDSSSAVNKLYGEADILRLKKEAVLALEQVYAGKYKAKEEDRMLAPRFDHNGEIIDYNYSMTIGNKKRDLGLDTDPFKVMGRTRASNLDKAVTVEHNRQVAELLKRDELDNIKRYNAGMNTIGKNNEYYVWVGDKSSRSDLREIWRALDGEIRGMLNSSDTPGDGGFYVRSGMVDAALGYREANLTDTEIGKRMPETIRYSLKIGGQLWDEIVRMFKQNILLKIPQVFAGNVTSNFALSIMYGKSPKETARYQLDAIRQLNAYLKDEERARALAALEVVYSDGKGGTINEKMFSKAQIRELRDVRSRIEQNPARELVDAGFYTKIMEELEASEGTGNLIKDTVSKKMEKVPSVIRNGLDWIWMSDANKFVKMMDTATQYSDFVARYAHYHMMIDKGDDPQKAMTQVKTMYVNYQAPTGRWLEWANKKGLVMFSKYFLGIQRAITHLATGHPLLFIVALLGQSALIDVSDITDSSIFSKNLANMLYSPISDTLPGALTPGSIILARELM